MRQQARVEQDRERRRSDRLETDNDPKEQSERPRDRKLVLQTPAREDWTPPTGPRSADNVRRCETALPSNPPEYIDAHCQCGGVLRTEDECRVDWTCALCGDDVADIPVSRIQPKRV